MTQTQILAAIDRDDSTAINAVIALSHRVASDEIEETGAPGAVAMITSLAAVAQGNRLLRAHGALPAEAPLLAPDQMDLLRRLLARYADTLAQIAAERTARRAR